MNSDSRCKPLNSIIFICIMLFILILAFLATLLYIDFKEVRDQIESTEEEEVENITKIEIEETPNIAPEIVFLFLLAKEYDIYEEYKEDLQEEVFEEQRIEVARLDDYDVIDEDIIQVSVTAYTNSPKEGWGNPNITANGTRVRDGIVAVSPDLLEKWGFETQIALMRKDGDEYKKVGVYQIEDRTHDRWRRTVDVFMFDRSEALKFGRRRLYAALVKN